MTANAPTITQRNDLDFGMDGDTPRYWFGGDAFKTRLFDAMSTLFPEGEKFLFSACAITVTRSPIPCCCRKSRISCGRKARMA